MRGLGNGRELWLLASVLALTACERGPEASPTRSPSPEPAASVPVPQEEASASGQAQAIQPVEPTAERRQARPDGRHELRWLWTPETVRRYALETKSVSDGTTETLDRRVWTLKVVSANQDGSATLEATLAEHRFHWTLPSAPHEVAFDSTDPGFAKNIDDPIMRAATLAVGLELEVQVDPDAKVVSLTGIEQLDARLDAEAEAHPDVFGDSDDVDMARWMLGMSYNEKGLTDQLEGLLRTHTLPHGSAAPGERWTRAQTLPVPMVGPMDLVFEQTASAVSKDTGHDDCLRYETTAQWSDPPPSKPGVITLEKFAGTSGGWTCFSHRAGEVVAGGWDATFDIVVSVNGTTVQKSERLHSELVLLR